MINVPGRPFFICTGWLNTSRAPAARSCSCRKARSSAEASSIWACCCSRVSQRVAPAPSSAPSANTSRSRLGRSSARLPRPMPTALGRSGGAWANRVARAAISAMPVGVVSSPGGKPSLLAKGIPRRWANSSTAGTGRGSRPWAVRTWPWPAGGGVHTSCSTPKCSRPAHTPTTSTRASTAPTSWKCTWSAPWPCTAPSASASCSNTANTRCCSTGSRGAAAICRRSSRQRRWDGAASSSSTSRCWPRRPPLRRSSSRRR